MTIHDIITERNYWRQFITRRNFVTKFVILFEEEKRMRGGVYIIDLPRFNTGQILFEVGR